MVLTFNILLSEDVSVPDTEPTWGEVATTTAYSSFALEIMKGKLGQEKNMCGSGYRTYPKFLPPTLTVILFGHFSA